MSESDKSEGTNPMSARTARSNNIILDYSASTNKPKFAGLKEFYDEKNE